MVNEKYQVVVSDPPWAYSDSNTGGSFKSGSKQHYMTLKPESVAKIHVSDIMEPDAVCFLWITVPLLPHGFDVMKSWGFEYKTSVFWYKVDPTTRSGRLGLGRYFRGMVEVCLVGIRGNIKPFACQSQNIIIEKPRKHSQKPEDMWRLIDGALRPHNMNRRIELFCRGEPHVSKSFMEPDILWDGWGNQCEGPRKVELDIL